MAKLADVLVERQMLSQDQLQHCAGVREQTGLSLGGAAIHSGFASGQDILELLAAQLEDPIEDFVPEALSPRLAEVLPGEVALQLQCVPVHDNGETLTVAFANEVDDLELEKLSEATQRQIEPFLVDPQILEAAYGMLYGGGEGQEVLEGGEASEAPEGEEGSVEEAIEGLDLAGGDEQTVEEDDEDGESEESGSSMPEIGDFKGVMSEALGEVQVVQAQEEKASAYGIEIEANSPPVVKLVNGMLIKALNLQASDIHIEPQEKQLTVRVRVDGELHPMMRLPRSVSNSISSRIKIMSSLNITEKRLPQDGRFKVKVGAAQVEFRVSSMPSCFGEKIVMRVLGGNKLKGDVTSLGFNERDLECVLTTLKSPWGMILVTGPTGSGKTTTLYTMLKSLNTPNRNVVTAEDPIEYNLPGITQVPVNPEIGYTFEKALKAFLRQDPDVILVGEIRDKTTAEIAVKAAMTGHIVLSTLHTNDAPSTILRLTNIGVDRFMLASGLKLVIAQRLVRLLCPHCKVPTKLSDEEKIGLKPEEIAKMARVYRGRGCPECHNIGYKGRRPIFEVLPVQSAKMKANLLDPNDAVIQAVAKEEGMRSLRESAVDLAAQGLISYQEVLRVGAAAG